MPLHIVRDLWVSIKNLQRRIASYFRYRKITAHLNDRFPNPTEEELEATDRTCIICREEMSSDACKKLPCSHIFHVDCLKMWVQRQQVHTQVCLVVLVRCALPCLVLFAMTCLFALLVLLAQLIAGCRRLVRRVARRFRPDRVRQWCPRLQPQQQQSRQSRQQEQVQPLHLRQQQELCHQRQQSRRHSTLVLLARSQASLLFLLALYLEQRTQQHLRMALQCHLQQVCHRFTMALGTRRSCRRSCSRQG